MTHHQLNLQGEFYIFSSSIFCFFFSFFYLIWASCQCQGHPPPTTFFCLPVTFHSSGICWGISQEEKISTVSFHWNSAGTRKDHTFAFPKSASHSIDISNAFAVVAQLPEKLPVGSEHIDLYHFHFSSASLLNSVCFVHWPALSGPSQLPWFPASLLSYFYWLINAWMGDEAADPCWPLLSTADLCFLHRLRCSSRHVNTDPWGQKSRSGHFYS